MNKGRVQDDGKMIQVRVWKFCRWCTKKRQMWRWGLTDPARRVEVQVDPRVLFLNLALPRSVVWWGLMVHAWRTAIKWSVEIGDGDCVQNFLSFFDFGLSLRGRFTRKWGICVCVFFFQGCVVVTRWWWWVYAGYPSLTVKRETMAGQNSPGDNSGAMDSGGDRLSNHSGMGQRGSGNDRRGMGKDRGSDDRRGDDRSKSMADRNAGETTRSGEGDSQDGSEDSLWRRARWFREALVLLSLTVFRSVRKSSYELACLPLVRPDFFRENSGASPVDWSKTPCAIRSNVVSQEIAREHEVDRWDCVKKCNARAAFRFGGGGDTTTAD